MKFNILFVFAVCCSIGVQARVVPNDPNPDVLIDFSAVSASLNSNASALLKIYAINIQTLPQLPIDVTQFSSTLFSLYITNAQSNNTNAPTFDDSFAVPSSVFSEQSYLAVEVWNYTTTVNNVQLPVFVGGTVLTVGQVEKLPQTDSLVLNNQSNQPVGLVNVNWSTA